MRTWTVRAAQAVLAGAAFAAAGVGIANADSADGGRSVVVADQAQRAPVIVPVTVPITVIGNRVSRDATLNTDIARSTQYRTIDNRGALNAAASNGDDTTPAPVLICGNAMSSRGIGTAACRGNAFVAGERATPAPQAAVGQQVAAAPQMAPAAPAAPAQQAAPQPAAAPVLAPAAQGARPIAPGRMAFIRHSAAAAPMAPLTICGNAGTVRGIASAACMGDALFERPATAVPPVGAPGA